MGNSTLSNPVFLQRETKLALTSETTAEQRLNMRS
jgi:hypothetical protein